MLWCCGGCGTVMVFLWLLEYVVVAVGILYVVVAVGICCDVVVAVGIRCGS